MHLVCYPFSTARGRSDVNASSAVRLHAVALAKTEIRGARARLKSKPIQDGRISMLTAIKLFHTVIWAVLAGCILALPIMGLMHRFDWAAALTVLVLVECGVLSLNRGTCPLSDLAARFTNERAGQLRHLSAQVASAPQQDDFWHPVRG